VIKIQNEIAEIEKAEKKAIGMIPEEYRKSNDEFMVEWFFGILGKGDLPNIGAVIPIFEIIKRGLIEFNFGKETKATTI
jgi:hypothetical protein